MRTRDLGFLLAFSTALLPAGAWQLVRFGVPPGLAAWFPVVFIFGVVPWIDALCGDERRNEDEAAAAVRLEHARYFRVLAALVVPVWLGLLAWCTARFAALDSVPAQLGWVVSTGVIGGVLAINPAHELIHKSTRWEPLLGGLLLTSVGYAGFKVEHVRGHHLHVATPEDSSSARLDESVYAFVPRALWRNVRNAWRLEAQRLRGRGRSPWWWRNEMVAWYALWLVFMAVFAWAGGLRALAFFLLQGVIAAATLEVINYVEHYGLERRLIAAGRYERVTHHHSWNAPQRYTNWLLFNLQRHSDHHAVARRRYQALRHHEDSPQLPAGYATMFVLALVPPLWRRVMNPRALACRVPGEQERSSHAAKAGHCVCLGEARVHREALEIRALSPELVRGRGLGEGALEVGCPQAGRLSFESQSPLTPALSPERWSRPGEREQGGGI